MIPLLLALLLQTEPNACTIHWELRIFAPPWEDYGVGIAFDPSYDVVIAKRDEVLRDGWRIPRLPGEHPDDVKWLLPQAINRWYITKWCCPGFPDPCSRPTS